MAALCPTAPIWSSFTESSCPVQHRQISVRSRSPDTTFITHGACLLLKRQLTFESDKLIALQGIVKQLPIRTSLEYHFGIWSGSIAGQLLWFAKPYTVLEPSESLKVNPTWSWASTMGHIVFNNGALAENLVTEIEIEGHRLTLDTQLITVPRSGSPTATGSVDMIDVSGRNIGWASSDERVIPSGPVYCPFISREVTIYDFGFSVLLVQPADTQAEEFRRVGLGGVTEDRGFANVERQRVCII